MKTTLTQKFCEAATSKGKPQADYYDAITPGLILRVAKGGKKVWAFMFTSPTEGKRARIMLGTFPATGLDIARQRAVEALGLVETGKDPRHLAPAIPDKTMAELIRERLDFEVREVIDPKTGTVKRKGKRTAHEIEGRYLNHLIPAIGNVPVKDFRVDPHYNKVIDPYVKAGKLRRAGVFHTDLVTLMKFAVKRGVIEFSRLTAAESPDPKNVRKRFLTTTEIVTVWTLLPDVFKLSKSVQRIIKLCLVTGQRLSEVSGMHRAEIDMSKRLWTIPAARVKNGEKYGDHLVPLSDLAMSIIGEAMRATNGDFLFPNEAGDRGLPKEVIGTTLRRAVEPRPGMPLGKFGIPKFTCHDLRRTVGTQMLNKDNKLGIPKFDKYLVLNHRSATKGNVSDEVYDQNEYLDEKREALDKWGRFLAKLVGEEIEAREAA